MVRTETKKRQTVEPNEKRLKVRNASGEPRKIDEYDEYEVVESSEIGCDEYEDVVHADNVAGQSPARMRDWFFAPARSQVRNCGVAFVQVQPIFVALLKPGAGLLLSYLVTYHRMMEKGCQVDEKNAGWFYCRYSRIARSTGLNKRTIEGLMKKLVQRGYVTREKRGGNDATQWWLKIDYVRLWRDSHPN